MIFRKLQSIMIFGFFDDGLFSSDQHQLIRPSKRRKYPSVRHLQLGVVCGVVLGHFLTWFFWVHAQTNYLVVFVFEDFNLVPVFIPHKIPTFGADVPMPVELYIYMLLETNWASISIFFTWFQRLLLLYWVSLMLQSQGAVVYFLVLLQYFQSVLVYEGLVVKDFRLIWPQGLRQDLGHWVVMSVAEIAQHSLDSFEGK